jgi:hypothetical protein
VNEAYTYLPDSMCMYFEAIVGCQLAVTCYDPPLPLRTLLHTAIHERSTVPEEFQLPESIEASASWNRWLTHLGRNAVRCWSTMLAS